MARGLEDLPHEQRCRVVAALSDLVERDHARWVHLPSLMALAGSCRDLRGIVAHVLRPRCAAMRRRPGRDSTGGWIRAWLSFSRGGGYGWNDVWCLPASSEYRSWGMETLGSSRVVVWCNEEKPVRQHMYATWVSLYVRDGDTGQDAWERMDDTVANQVVLLDDGSAAMLHGGRQKLTCLHGFGGMDRFQEKRWSLDVTALLGNSSDAVTQVAAVGEWMAVLTERGEAVLVRSGASLPGGHRAQRLPRGTVVCGCLYSELVVLEEPSARVVHMLYSCGDGKLRAVTIDVQGETWRVVVPACVLQDHGAFWVKRATSRSALVLTHDKETRRLKVTELYARYSGDKEPGRAWMQVDAVPTLPTAPRASRVEVVDGRVVLWVLSWDGAVQTAWRREETERPFWGDVQSLARQAVGTQAAMLLGSGGHPHKQWAMTTDMDVHSMDSAQGDVRRYGASTSLLYSAMSGEEKIKETVPGAHDADDPRSPCATEERIARWYAHNRRPPHGIRRAEMMRDGNVVAVLSTPHEGIRVVELG